MIDSTKRHSLKPPSQNIAQFFFNPVWLCTRRMFKILLIVSMGGLCFLSSAGSSIFRQYTLPKEINSIHIQLHNSYLLVKPSQKISSGKKANKTNKKKTMPRGGLSQPVERTVMVWFKKKQAGWSSRLKQKIKDQAFILSDKNFPSLKAKDKAREAVEILLPEGLSVHVRLFTGEIKIQNLKNTNIFVAAPGRSVVETANTSGKLQVFQAAGQLSIRRHKGPIHLQGENTRLFMEHCQGPIHISHFKGQARVKNSKGRLNLRAFKAHDVLKNFEGRLTFHIEQGFLKFRPVIGSVEGQAQSAHITGVLHPHEVNIQTNTGRIALDMPHSKAWVTAESWEGKIRTPNYFNRIKTGGMDRSQGRLRGRGRLKTGKVILNSRSGSISVGQSRK